MIYLGEQIEARDKFYHKVNCWVRKKLLGAYSTTNSTGYKCKVENCDICKIGFHSFDAGDFTTFILPRLDSIIISRPDRLINLEAQYTTEWEDQGLGNADDFKNHCAELFKTKGYTGWFTGYSINYNLAEWLDRHTCTFCNRQYIFVARKENGAKGINCQFDHWFDKASHPLLALSFYNLIPSCSVCNSSVKSTSSFNTEDHWHPYLDQDISEKFTFSYFKNSISDNEISFANEARLDKKTLKTLEDTGTKLVYKRHSSKELQDLIDLRYKYSDNYLEILLEKTFGNLHISKEERYRLIFGIELDSEDYHKRPFSKFKNDIITELLNNT